MKHQVRLYITLTGMLLWAPVAGAQQEGHQMPGMAQGNVNVGPCVQSSQAVTAALEQANAQIEEARQINDAMKMRAAVGDLQLLLTQMKGQLADCVALAAQAQSATANMPGMDHSKMAANAAAAPGEPASATQAGGSTAVSIALRSQPTPARVGENQFEVTLTDAKGKPVTDADVTLDLYMPAMPAMKMPEMRNRVKLTSAGNGVYRSGGNVGMAGQWDATITATRNGQPIGITKVKLTAR